MLLNHSLSSSPTHTARAYSVVFQLEGPGIPVIKKEGKSAHAYALHTTDACPAMGKQPWVAR